MSPSAEAGSISLTRGFDPGARPPVSAQRRPAAKRGTGHLMPPSLRRGADSAAACAYCAGAGLLLLLLLAQERPGRLRPKSCRDEILLRPQRAVQPRSKELLRINTCEVEMRTWLLGV